jgi:hypothetical protein
MACEKTIFVGGTVTDYQSGDSIEGIEMGLYMAKPEFDYEDKKWSDLELIVTATSNSEGFFSMEIDEDMDLSHNVFYYPLPPTDTLLVNAKYTTWATGNFFQVRNGIDYVFKLNRPTLVQFDMINFEENEINIKSTDGFNKSFGLKGEIMCFAELLAGNEYKFDFYEVIESNRETMEYLGSTSRYIKTQLPEDSDKVDWLMPWQIIEIDFNTLEK